MTLNADRATRQTLFLDKPPSLLDVYESANNVATYPAVEPDDLPEYLDNGPVARLPAPRIIFASYERPDVVASAEIRQFDLLKHHRKLGQSQLTIRPVSLIRLRTFALTTFSNSASVQFAIRIVSVISPYRQFISSTNF